MAAGKIAARQAITLRQYTPGVGGDEIGDPNLPKEDQARRYKIILRIRHCDLDPSEVTTALGWKPDLCWRAGDQSVTPNGRKLPSFRHDGAWSYRFEYNNDRNIAEKLDRILDHLKLSKALFEKLYEIGAQSALYLQLPGDVNKGDRIPWEVLKKFADLRIAFELETFPRWT